MEATSIKSIWSRTCSLKERAALNGDIRTEAAVIGGGMAGILIAYELERAGVKTTVLEAERIGSGQTKNTTAKITFQHGMFCNTFIEKKGMETAEKYVRANQAAVEEYRKIIKEEEIDCELEEQDSYAYSSDEDTRRPPGIPAPLLICILLLFLLLSRPRPPVPVQSCLAYSPECKRTVSLSLSRPFRCLLRSAAVLLLKIWTEKILPHTDFLFRRSYQSRAWLTP